MDCTIRSTADLRLSSCFRLCMLLVFLCVGSFICKIYVLLFTIYTTLRLQQFSENIFPKVPSRGPKVGISEFNGIFVAQLTTTYCGSKHEMYIQK